MGDQPKCSIDYSRRVSLPFSVAPEVIGASEIPNYLNYVDIDVELLNNSFTAFTPSSVSNTKNFKVLASSDGSFSILLPEFTNYSGATSALLLTDSAISKVIRPGSAQTSIPDGSNGTAIALELIKKVVFNNNAEKLSALPLPFCTQDAIRSFWIKQSASPLTTTFGVNIADTPTRAYLLPTQTDAGVVTPGEVDRLLVRAPALSLARFEPYYHFKWDGTDLSTICQSNSGRLVFKTQHNTTRSETRVFETTTIAYDNVDKKSLYKYVLSLFTFQIENLSAFIIKNESNLSKAIKTKATLDRLNLLAPSVPVTFTFESPKTFYANLINGIRKSLQGWVLYKKNKLDVEPLDLVNHDDIKAAYPKAVDLYESNGGSAVPESKAKVEDVLDFITIILASVDLKESFYIYLTQFHIPLSLGTSWSQCFLDAEIPFLRKFPVPGNEAPKNASDKTSKAGQKEQAWLETIFNDKNENNAFVCFSGCPLGFPSAVYDTVIPSTKSKYPATALTTFELEALILTSKATTKFPAITTMPVSNGGNPLDLAAYDPHVAGYSMNFQLYPKNFFYTAIDWFQELLKKTNGLNNEGELINLIDTNYFDLVDRNKRHPVSYVSNYDDYFRSLSIRNQLDVLNALTPDLQVEQLNWWCSNNDFVPDAGAWPDGSARSPSDSYRPAATRTGVSAAMHSNRVVSGFDEFDIASAFIARNQVLNPITGLNDYPIALVLNLMEREGVRTFALFNRCIRPKHSFKWVDFLEFWNNGDSADAATFTSSFMGRLQWLRWPYGLDTYNVSSRTPGITENSRFNIVIDLLKAQGIVTGWDASDARSYVDERVDTSFVSNFPAPNNTFSVFKNTKRCHWSFISFMLGWFSAREKDIRNKTNFSTDSVNPFAYTSSKGWVTDDFSAEPDPQLKKKNMITYYSLIYLSYNAGETMWNNIVADVEGRHGLIPVRDFLLFKYTTANAGRHMALSNMIHFAVGLDAMLRINEIPGSLSAAVTPDSSDITNRNSDWGI